MLVLAPGSWLTDGGVAIIGGAGGGGGGGGGRGFTIDDLVITDTSHQSAGTAYEVAMVSGETTILSVSWASQGKYVKLPSIGAMVVGTSIEIWNTSTNWFLNVNGDGTDLIMTGGGLPAVQQVQVAATEVMATMMVVNNRNLASKCWRWNDT